MKKLLLLPFLLLLGIGALVIWLYFNTQPVSGNKEFSNFLITKGSSASAIGNKLQSAGLIKSSLAFRIYLQFTGQAKKIQTGEFRLSPSFNLFQVVDQLSRGPIEIWVTVPEGLRREEIAGRFASNLDRDQAFVNEFLDSSKGKEGYLFPDTYLFPKNASASAVVAKMARTFDAKTLDLTQTGSTLSSKDLVTLASLIERETKGDVERPVVAGIILNRLNAGWPLQIDASVQYAIANDKCHDQGSQSLTNAKCKDWWPILTKADLQINSPYNSYKFTGLPPSPIASPGITSIKAAYNPEANDYWYYIHDNSGVIHYAKTLAEHNQNIRQYLGK